MPTGRADEPAPLAEFSRTLKVHRERSGLSQAGLAHLVLVHRDMIAKIEAGRRWPTHDLVVRFEAVLNADGALAQLWPAVESDRTRRILLAAQERLATKLRQHTAVPPQLTDVAGAVLGRGPLTIITPLKQEAIRARPVVALEDVVGAQRLAGLAMGHGLSSTFETVPIGGEVDLNRPDLVVICGPRLSRRIAAVLDQDGLLRFGKAPDGVWTLYDIPAGKVHRSGLDEHPARHSDVAYLGRLPRPDGQGTLLIFTGIHPQGSLGVVRFLTEELAQLYAETGGRCFSMLLRTWFHPDTSEPIEVERLSPVHLQEAPLR